MELLKLENICIYCSRLFYCTHHTDEFEQFLSLTLDKIMMKTGIYIAYGEVLIQFICPGISHMFHKVGKKKKTYTKLFYCE